MSSQIISKEGNTVKISFDVTPEKFEEGMKYSYNKNKNKISVPGFRKGKVPRKVVEAEFGPEFLYEDAVNWVLNEVYPEVVAELNLDVVALPDIDVKEVGKEIGAKFEASVTVKPEVKLGQYKGIEVEDFSSEVTEDEIKAHFEKIQNDNARLVPVEDRPAQMGDTVTISYLGTVDGVAFEGGKGENYPLELGSGSFIPGFEEQVAGHKSEEEFDVNVTFPEDYAAELAGKDAVFKCKIHEIKSKELPELDDEFAKDVSEFDPLDELKADIKKQMNERKAEEAKNDFENQLIEQVIDNMECEVPKCMFDKRADEMVQDYAYRLQMQGIDLDTYLKYLGQDKDAFKATFKDGAQKQVKASIALEAIVEAEKLEATEEEIDAEIAKLAEQYQMEAEQIKKAVPADQIAADVKTKKAIDIIVDSAVKE